MLLNSNTSIMKTSYFLCLFVLLLSCEPNQNTPAEPSMQQMDKWKAEVTKVETDFAIMAKESGVPTAFLHFAAEDAVLNRNNIIIKGKAAIEEYFAKQTLQDVQLSWSPDLVEVSESGDLAYTYGGYTFSAKDAEGNPIESEGIFHTVWKRQSDGSWKYVWD